MTKFSQMDSLPNLLTHSAPLCARFARARSSATTTTTTTAITESHIKSLHYYSGYTSLARPGYNLTRNTYLAIILAKLAFLGAGWVTRHEYRREGLYFVLLSVPSGFIFKVARAYF